MGSVMDSKAVRQRLLGCFSFKNVNELFFSMNAKSNVFCHEKQQCDKRAVMPFVLLYVLNSDTTK